MNQIISFQGELGANSHIACKEVHPDWTVLPSPTFEDAFAAVIDGQAELAMIPIENSIAGRVADIHHLLPMSGLHIVGEHFLPIHFQLMALPGAKLADIKSVHSHVHALGPVPEDHPEARPEGGGERRHGRARRARLPNGAIPQRPRSHPACRRTSTGWKSSPRMSRTRATTPLAS